MQFPSFINKLRQVLSAQQAPMCPMDPDHALTSKIVSIQHFRLNSPRAWFAARSSSPAARVAPRIYGSRTVDFNLSSEPYPEMGVVDISLGALVGSHGLAFTGDWRWISECSWWGEAATEQSIPSDFGERVHAEGTCLSLASDHAASFGHFNFGHFLLDCLPRLKIALDSGFTLSEIDSFYIPEPKGTTAKKLMDALGIPSERCIWARENMHVRADRLLATTFPGRRRDYPEWAAEYLRQPFETDKPRRRRIFVPREGVRKPVNQAELIVIAEQFGFEVYNFRTHANEPEFFQEASIVVGAHGAGLSCLTFCARGTKCLELLPSDHIYPYYYTLSAAAGLQYGYLVGVSEQERPPETFGPSPFDFHVNPVEFEAAISDLIGS